MIYETRCPHCGSHVYYYTSEHDSKVFFDDVGYPWPKHECTNYTMTDEEFESFFPQLPILSDEEIDSLPIDFPDSRLSNGWGATFIVEHEIFDANGNSLFIETLPLAAAIEKYPTVFNHFWSKWKRFVVRR